MNSSRVCDCLLSVRAAKVVISVTGYFWSLSRVELLYSNSYALSQNYSAVLIVATLSYNIPISEIETLFLSADLASFVVAVSEMARV